MKPRYAWGIALLVLLPALVGAFQPKTDKTDLNQKEFFLPELYISSSTLSLQEISDQLKNRNSWNRFFTANGADFHVYFDPRSGTPVNIMGSIPLIPGNGKGNKVTVAGISRKLGRNVDAVDDAVAADLFANWVRANKDVLGIDARQLGASRAAAATPNLWHLNIPQVVNGIPVRYARVLAAVNHGNMVIVGTENWGNVKIDTLPRISAAQARELGFAYAGGMSSKDIMLKEPALEIIPYAPREFTAGEGFAGPVGSGYGHRLCWIFEFQRAPDLARWEVMVDAHTAEVIAFQDTNHYVDAKITGGAYPLTNTEICPDNIRCGTMNSDVPMPFADIGGGLFTNSAGHYDYTGGTTTTTFSGRYVDMTDTCGAPSFSGAGDINLGGVNGDHDCVTAGPAGNTAATRSGMFEMNKIFEEARGYLPANPWLQGNQTGPLPTNMNIVNTCNAFYSTGDPGSVNFYRTGGGCRNTGEIAAVFDHEWGHGMDDHDTGGVLSSSSEGYADIASMYRLWASCVGYGFFWTADRGCGTTADGTGFNQNEAQTGPAHCDTDCSGVRDSDWAKHVGGAPDTVTFTCASCLSGSGPCGRQVHCSATTVRQMAWDFVARDLQAPPFNYDNNTAFIIGDKVFYQGSGNIGSWHNCTCPSTSDGCAAANGYPNWLAADDDNGNLNDGTPHMTAIFNAYNRHGIACATPTVQNSGCASGPATPPVVTSAPGSNQITLNWGSVAGAVQYKVYRGEGYAGCGFGKALIGSTAGTSFSDPDVGNGRAYGYVVMAEGADDACFSPASTCVVATPQPCAGAVSLDSSSYSCSDTVGISLVDSDLIGNGTQNVNVTSSVEGTPEVVTLTETPPNSGQFSGTINTTSAPPAADGLLSVTNGSTITVTYHDASFCGPAQDVSSNGAADCLGPAISNVQATNLTEATATITWDTNEVANSRVTYAPAPGPPSINQDDLSNYVLAHSVNLSGLNQCSDYVFSVTSEDIAGNSLTDSNSGAFYSFTTTGIGFLFNDDVESGGAAWTAAGTAGNVFNLSTCDASSPTHSWRAGPVTCATQYSNNVTTTLTSVAGYEVEVGSRLRFNERLATESGFDFCRPQISTNGGTTWTDLDSYSGTAGWRAKEYDLSAFAGPNRKIRFQFTSDVTVTGEGWFIDDIQVTYPAPCGTNLAFGSSAITDDCSGGGPGDADGVLDPGEIATVQVTTNNTGLLNATNVTAVLSTSTAGVTILDNTASFPDIAGGGSGVSIAPHFAIAVGTGVPCGTVIDFTLDYTANEGNWTDTFTLTVGLATGGTFVSTDVPKTILDLQTVDSIVNISGPGTITDVDVTLSITHTFDGDLDIFLIGPGGSPTVELTTDNGGAGDNMINTTFDDEAATAITAGVAPFTGSFRPEGTLTAFDGMAVNGTWTLRITDDANVDTGTLTAWALTLTTQNGFVCNNCAPACPAITLSPPTLPNGTAGVAYNQTITASGGSAPYTFTDGGGLPPGVTLATDGTLSGTPTASGTFNFTVTATDNVGCTGQLAYTLTIDCPAITLSPSTLPNGGFGVPYNQAITASGGTAPYTFTDGGGLPPGITLATDGTLSGTPTLSGSFNFTVTATDDNGCTGQQAYSLTIDPCPAITLSPPTLPNGGLGAPYTQTITAGGGTAPYTFSDGGGLPTGLTLATDGTLSGTPTATGTFNFTVTATDNNGCTGQLAYSLTIDPCPAITLSPPTLPNGQVGAAYNQTITASGGTAPYTFTDGGGLPAGITLAADGTLSGTPTATGTSNFTVTATDNNGCTGQLAYSLTIDPPCLFCDDFEDGVLDANWTYIKPAWTEAGGVLTATPTTRKAVAVASPVFGGCSNCYMEATMQSGGGIGNIVWLLGWYVDKKNTVELLMKEQNDKWLLKERINGVIAGKAKAILPIDPNTLYRARIVFNGAQFQVFIDGNLAITLAAHGAHTGTVGFQVKRTVGTFGEVIVN